MTTLGEVWDEAVHAYDWLKSLTLGEFAEERPTSVIVTDMLLAMTVPGAVIVTSARDLAAVCLRLGRRYEGMASGAQNAAHPEWQEWVVLIASALGVFGPVICAAVGSLVGAMIGDEAAAVIRAVCLLLIDRGGQVLEKVVGFLARFTKGNIVKLLQKIHFAAYGDALVRKLTEFLQGMRALIVKAQEQLSRIEYIGRARELLAALERMEKQFYAVQVNCVGEIPQALAKLDEALQKLLQDKLPPTYHPAYAGVPAPMSPVSVPERMRVSSGIGELPKVLSMSRDGVNAAGGAAHGDAGRLPERQEPVPGSSNVHRDDVAKMSRAQKGIFGEKVSDDFMKAKGYRSELWENRQMRLLEQQPTGRGIDGVYRKPPGEPPPPYVVTETKFRTGGKFDAKDLPTTKGSNGYPRAKQGSSGWVGPRIADAVDRKTALTINKTGYDFWLIVVDESGMVVDITKLDSNANEIGKIAL
ncbi:hypothetical protein EN871_12885 [bacterium M00.F.Ca.ET.228.01.1.1]|uniref:hypothetical protein n=1 Tax=Paraburkholderia phenoliruptrix TaxID=252970 RepID=UPI00109213EF|nr:hypothetical protein [Paraburkholderia phenoliruptrix]TGP43921.1 hypothetical protein EN871_12885 [bacterium M00.F.Ca.ET.228.01.1.1]TGS01584.1 hypothetical protein EN834_12880 [bacterium M00.F.Ca.ET.191.01.1.1]TGU08810.1 hypothetical protein EN798_06650 [bacterium M00.F.Ca.ET.155.01.1.1]MBW0449007.1 hypothetical protein [Paraburkholderia phenoliruptrix]MBW9097416.1 hypothetical protein [Paraburkholderia phenoliruptrix]